MSFAPDRPTIVGKRFGRLVVVEYAGSRRGGGSRWECRCDCGGVKAVAANELRCSKTRSCGCLAREMAVKLGKANRKHGHAASGSETPEYRAWGSMLTRCRNDHSENWKLYGGRGIGVCREWQASFAAFLRDVGPRPSPRHTLDRRDSNGNYEPGNVRWATMREQQRNRRNNRVLTIDGVTRPVAEWAEMSGVAATAIYQRLRRLGWDAKRAVFEPNSRRSLAALAWAGGGA